MQCVDARRTHCDRMCCSLESASESFLFGLKTCILLGLHGTKFETNVMNAAVVIVQ